MKKQALQAWEPHKEEKDAIKADLHLLDIEETEAPAKIAAKDQEIERLRAQGAPKGEAVAVFCDKPLDIVADLHRRPSSPAAVDDVLDDVLGMAAAVVNRGDPALEARLREALVMRLHQFTIHLRRHEHVLLRGDVVEIRDGVGMVCLDDVVERLDLVVGDGLEQLVGRLGIHRHRQQRIFEPHKRSQTLEHAVAESKVDGLEIAVGLPDHLAFHRISGLPVIGRRIGDGHLLAPFGNVGERRHGHIGHARAASGRGVFPLVAEAVHTIAELVALLDRRAVDGTETHDLVPNEAIRDEGCRLVPEEAEVVGLEIELRFIRHDALLCR